jgi:hypothetical protein
MTPEDNAHDQELLERYKRASDTLDAAPSETVRAAVLAEARRVAEQRATETPRQTFDVSRPAANDSRWRITAFGTAGAALVAALLFAPRLWESGPVAPATSSGAPAAAAPREQSSDEKSISPKAESPALPAPHADKTSPNATVLQPRRDVPMPPQHRQTEEIAQSAAPAEKADAANFAPAAPPPAAGAAPRAAASGAARATSMNAQRAAVDTDPAPTALRSAAASGDTAQTALLLDQGAALDARDELGRTPLMLAVMQNRPDVARLLLDRGADPNLTDNSGHTPLQQAKQAHLSEMAAMLERAGAR